MEGISGLVRWADVTTAGQDYPRNRSIMTRETNAAIEGAFLAGASEVVVEENHGVQDLTNLVMDEIDPRCRVIRGAGSFWPCQSACRWAGGRRAQSRSAPRP